MAFFLLLSCSCASTTSGAQGGNPQPQPEPAADPARTLDTGGFTLTLPGPSWRVVEDKREEPRGIVALEAGEDTIHLNWVTGLTVPSDKVAEIVVGTAKKKGFQQVDVTTRQRDGRTEVTVTGELSGRYAMFVAVVCPNAFFVIGAQHGEPDGNERTIGPVLDSVVCHPKDRVQARASSRP